MGIFAWIRRQVRDAVVAGFEDGLASVANGDGDTAPALESLRVRLATALPAPEEEPKRKRGGA